MNICSIPAYSAYSNYSVNRTKPQSTTFGRSGASFVESLGRTVKGMIEYTVTDLPYGVKGNKREELIDNVVVRNIKNIYWNATGRTNNPHIDDDIRVIKRHASYDGVSGAKMRAEIAKELGLKDPTGKTAEYFNRLV